MSKIRLHGSSSGYTEIAPVAASGNNTLTLPNDGTIISKDSNGAVGVTSITVGTGVTIGDGKITCDGSALTSINAANLVGVCTSGLTKTGGFGKILQVKQSVKTDTFSTNAYLTETDIGLQQTITPSSSDSKILIIANINYGGVANNYAGITLKDDSTGSMSPTYRADALNADNGNALPRYSTTADSVNVYKLFNCGIEFLHSPNVTSEITYKLTVYNTLNSSPYFYLNRPADIANQIRSIAASSITLIEIAA